MIDQYAGVKGPTTGNLGHLHLPNLGHSGSNRAHSALVAVGRDAVNQLQVGLGNRNLQRGFSLAGIVRFLGGYGAFVGAHRHNPLRYIINNVNTKKLRLFP
jgi:hypothetical protein